LLAERINHFPAGIGMGALDEKCYFGILDLVFIEERIVFASKIRL